MANWLEAGHIVYTIAGFILTYAVYGFCLGIYRVYFHPLSSFPGPKLAAATLWYEFYHDVWKRGRFAWEIRRMHKVYGPVVRINPHELHVDVPDFYEELYVGGRGRRHKYEWSTNMFEVPGAMVTTADHDLHRKRRAPLAPYFSMQAIRRFDPVIRDKLEILSQRLEGYRRNGQIVDLDTAFTALTTDIITQYAYGISHGFLEAQDFGPDWPQLLLNASEQSLIAKQMPWYVNALRKIPLGWLLKIKPEITGVIQFQAGIRASLDGVLASRKEGAEQDKHATIFHGLLQSGLPESELKSARLTGEAQTVVAAGTLTTAHFLKSTTYHLLSNPPMLQSLNEELKQVMPDTATLPPFSDLEKLPYLNAVINEGLRISHGIIARLTRIAPDEDLHVAGYTITAGTPVSMSSWLVHLNPTLFPSPNEFRPQRWLEPGADGLKKYLCNFTRGSRVCLGKDLARTEMVYTLALMVRKWAGEQGTGMKLYETSRVDVDIAHDFFNPFPVLHSKGVRVVLE